MILVGRRASKLVRAAAASFLSLLFSSAPVGLTALAQNAQRESAASQQAQTSDPQASTQGQPQAPPQTPQEPTSKITQEIKLSPDVPSVRVGVDSNQKQMMSLQDAITLALGKNLDIESFRQGVRIAQSNLFAARGAYDITTTSDINFRTNTSPVTSIFSGGDAATAATNNKALTYNFITSEPVSRGGGLWEVDFLNNRLTTSRTDFTLNDQYTPTLTLAYTQPLMRNLSIDSNRRSIQLAKRGLDLSDSQFRQRVIEIINSTQRAYWDLVFAIKNEQIARDTVEVTRVQLNNNRKQVDAGTLAPIDLRSTEAAFEARKGDVITALQGVTTAENALKSLMINDASDKIWSAQIVPTDEPQFGNPTIKLDEASRLALKNRPELEQMQLQVQQKNIDIQFFKNQLKPQLDFLGVYSNTGVAGRRQSAVGSTVTAPERFVGGYFRALANTFSQDFRTIQVGVKISLPWRNRLAEANYGKSLAESRQLDAKQRQLVQSILFEVRNALQAVEAALQRVQAAEAGKIASQAQLDGELERFRAGLSTNFFVLQRQSDLAVAKGNEVRARTDYNKALADLQRITGLTLVSNNVQLEPSIPDLKSDKPSAGQPAKKTK